MKVNKPWTFSSDDSYFITSRVINMYNCLPNSIVTTRNANSSQSRPDKFMLYIHSFFSFIVFICFFFLFDFVIFVYICFFFCASVFLWCVYLGIYLSSQTNVANLAVCCLSDNEVELNWDQETFIETGLNRKPWLDITSRLDH